MGAKLEPYLNFNGNCQEAMEFYEKVMGGKLSVTHFSDYNKDAKPKDGEKEGVMHATLANDDLSFMASDAMPDKPVEVGGDVYLSVAGTDAERLTKMFNDLAEGGKVLQPLAKQVWGDTFGMFIDKFGKHWMFNIGSDGSIPDREEK